MPIINKINAYKLKIIINTIKVLLCLDRKTCYFLKKMILNINLFSISVTFDLMALLEYE